MDQSTEIWNINLQTLLLWQNNLSIVHFVHHAAYFEIFCESYIPQKHNMSFIFHMSIFQIDDNSDIVPKILQTDIWRNSTCFFDLKLKIDNQKEAF